ncbi:hypothetical protein CROQUDRAFT_666607 [Cronartium quercuum f. sp. fusiforme G11]|uniref:Uncharacterized protein n=1 Tax=Cronartium quercuum f. sp. fusiforme G11 TaxID=708437 RepID=A0A9P6T579_9BASI|nr:hypothetical protein CROQUDRAFT_666607 [Cronartium quercuum f. sp. fusiforme G11]
MINNINNDIAPTLPDINHPKQNLNCIASIDDILQKECQNKISAPALVELLKTCTAVRHEKR